MKRNSTVHHTYFSTISILLILALSTTGSADDVVTSVPSTVSTPTSTSTTTTTLAPTPSTVVSTTTPSSKQLPSTTKKPNSKFLIVDCPSECTCTEDKKINCDNKELKKIPTIPKNNDAIEISLRGNHITSLELNLFQSSATLKKVDLSDNDINSITPYAKSFKSDPKLKTLILSGNSIEDLKNFSTWNLNSLEELDISANSLNEIGPQTFNKSTNLVGLKLDRNLNLNILPNTFANLPKLKYLNLAGVTLTTQLGDKSFVKNQKLEVVDLSDCKLHEVPIALRAIGQSLKNLTLNNNLMTSLRESDFINATSIEYLEIRECPKLKSIDDSALAVMTNLTTLIVADNPKLQYISKDVFGVDGIQKFLVNINISGNNLTTLHHDLGSIKRGVDSSYELKSLILNNNPWSCNCDLKWLQTIPMSKRSPAHCKTPDQYKDMELAQYFSTTDCQSEADSRIHTIVVTGFLLFLFALTVAVFVQKSEFCRRFLWKDQYGTIYYTKASFPTENV